MRLQKTRTIPGLFNSSTPHPRPSGPWGPEFLVPEYLGTIFADSQSTRVPGYLGDQQT